MTCDKQQIIEHNRLQSVAQCCEYICTFSGTW